MRFVANLDDNGDIIVTKQRDINNLYHKNRYGSLKSKDRLLLDPIEVLFLVGEGKLDVYKDGRIIDFHSLLKKSASIINDIDIRYLAYRDLRLRGYKVKIKSDSIADFIIEKIKDESKYITAHVKIFSEMDTASIDYIEHAIDYTISVKSSLWFMIIDEEGDITYYNISKPSIKGEIREYNPPSGEGYLLHNRVVVFNPELATYLHQQGFYGKPFGNALQLSLIEAIYLENMNVLRLYSIKDDKKIKNKEMKDIIKNQQDDVDDYLRVFADLKNKGLIVKTGFKFGTNFRVYTRRPDLTHAEYLVHIVPYKYKGVWSEISRGVRLAHSVNKEFILAYTKNNKVEYISLGRLRA
ncbi:MAG: tRNA-intron lyase [Candidatus Thermoplasmatota archaeon]